ncbi:MAG: endonuclease [Bacteroidetes bacterium]|nr:endonuclease [Bacteroidota bacterium]
MKKIYSLLIAVTITASAFAQAVLPTSWNFATTTLPTGWSETNVNTTSQPYYTGSGNPAPAYKLDATGDILMVNVASTPGNLTYDLTGNSFSGGTFLIQESANGSTWNTLRTITAPGASYAPYTETLNSASRYVRFYYQNKVSGNIGLDNVSITAGVSAAQEISIKQGTTTIVNGGTYSFSSPVSTLTPVTFTVYNLGLAILNVSSASISGPAAADYSVATATPFTVSGQSNTSLVVNFTPSSSGTRDAILTIANDDVNANPYIINLDGIGGTLATEPTAQATNLTFSNVKSYHITGSYTAASGSPDGYIILRKTGSAVTDVPIDGTVYKRGDLIGSSQVVAVGNVTGFFPNNIVANTTYHFAVFAYNGTSTFRNYLTTAPLTGNVTSSGSMQPSNYYNTVSTSSSSFVTDLHNKINPHTTQFYSNYGPYMVAKFLARDTVNDQRVITCSYSGLNKVYSEPFDWTTNDFAREHTFCQSWMPTVNDANFTSRPEYSDYHMIVQANQNNVNGIRSNYPLGEVVGTPTYTYLGCKLGPDANGKTVFEPRDSDKGDAARCMLYQTICYTGVTYAGAPNTNATYGGSWSLPLTINSTINYAQDQNVLKIWHYQDPPDNWEIARNDYVDSLQGNRNPFIDSANYVCYIDFSTMTKIATPNVPCNTVGIFDNQKSNDKFLIAPNPTTGNFKILFNSSNNQNLNVNVYDIFGRVVARKQTTVSNGNNTIEMNLEGLSKGLYSIEIVTDSGRKSEKLIID